MKNPPVLAKKKIVQSNPKLKVFTPTWCTNEDYIHRLRNNIADRIEKNSRKHFQMEKIEKRIAEGKEQGFYHPASSPDVEQKHHKSKAYSEDFVLPNNYTPVQEKTTIPMFWERRVWDKNENKLSIHENAVLVDTIKSCNSKHYIPCNSIPKTENTKDFWCFISVKDFETEDEDIVTDSE